LFAKIDIIPAWQCNLEAENVEMCFIESEPGESLQAGAAFPAKKTTRRLTFAFSAGDIFFRA
jgi:hypothetical protein